MSDVPTLLEATEAFVRGFSFTRSFTHAYLVQPVAGDAWRLHDAPRRSGDRRSEEFVAVCGDADRVAGMARESAGGHYKICVILPLGADDRSMRDGFRRLNHRLMTTEDLFVHRLTDVPDRPEALPVVRLATVGEAERLAKAARRRQVLPEHLLADPPPMRQYMVVDGERPVGWVGSVDTGGHGWVTNLLVEPHYRRRGLGAALMSRLLRDDALAGFRSSVLLASHTGSLLYPRVGYEAIGRLYCFVPPR